MANARAHASAFRRRSGPAGVSMSGDGGFAMPDGDLITLTQMKLPVKIVIFNNGVLGFDGAGNEGIGFIETGVDLQNPDFGPMARHGHSRIRVEDPGDLQKASATCWLTTARPCSTS